jgi:hypothetical protein
MNSVPSFLMTMDNLRVCVSPVEPGSCDRTGETYNNEKRVNTPTHAIRTIFMINADVGILTLYTYKYRAGLCFPMPIIKMDYPIPLR